MYPPAISRDGRVRVYAQNVSPDGSKTNTFQDLIALVQGVTLVNQYALTALQASQNPVGTGITAASLTPDGMTVAYAMEPPSGGRDEVHLINSGTKQGMTVAVNTAGCVKPVDASVLNGFPCVLTPHISPDGGKVVFAVRGTFRQSLSTGQRYPRGPYKSS